MSKFRINQKKFHVTYKTHIDQEQLLDFFRGKRDLSRYSVVWEIGDEGNDYEHTHALVEFSKPFESRDARCFDFQGIHPNIQSVTSEKHWENTWEYHEKAPIKLTRDGVKKTVQLLHEQIQKAETLADAAEIAGVTVRSYQDLVIIRKEKKRKAAGASYIEFSRPLEEGFRALVIWGPTGTGKTQYALAHFKQPLLVSHMDDLKDFDENRNDGIVFDDMSFQHLPRESMIHMLDWDVGRSIHCRHTCAYIPEHTRKIFTTNNDHGCIFPVDDSGAIGRRISRTLHVNGPLFNINNKGPKREESS